MRENVNWTFASLLIQKIAEHWGCFQGEARWQKWEEPMIKDRNRRLEKKLVEDINIPKKLAQISWEDR